MSLLREKRRLDRAFHAVLLALGSPAIVVACSSSGGGGGADAGGNGPPDATIARDGSEEGDAPYDAPADHAEHDAGKGPALDSSVRDAGGKIPVDASGGDAAGCFLTASELDASYEDADLCAYVYGCGGLEGTGLTPVGCTVLQTAPMVEGGVLPIPGMSCWLPQGLGCDEDAYAPVDGGVVTVLCSPCPPGGGRRPAGMRNDCRTRRGGVLPVYLARMAFEEDAAVVAFVRMEAELAALGAPVALQDGARRAAADEVRHARAMARLARRGGGAIAITRARAKRQRARSARAVAAENAAEGCVRETFGALLMLWQAQHAEDAEIREAFGTIAREEARHAALSWALARWIEPRLDAAGTRKVAAARRAALRALEQAVAIEPPPELAAKAGLPTASEARALLAGMKRELGMEA